MKVLVTGGCGFIGSAVCRHMVQTLGWSVVNVDALTYAASPEAVAMLSADPACAERYAFVQADICDRAAMDAVFAAHQPDAVMHLAAETHVDRSIDGPEAFLHTNVMGVFSLLQAARGYYDQLTGACAERFRFHHVSTDEVFGALEAGDPRTAFCEDDPYRPNSPYAASKAASDHLIRAWAVTYGLPVVVSNCGNNYGPYQFPEKFIPLALLKVLEGQPLPVYGDGLQRRDWIHVEDHARALCIILENGAVGETYLVGARAVRTNLDVARAICAAADAHAPENAPHERLITHVSDRPGHDRAYAIDPSHLERDLGWRPVYSFENGLEATVAWYVEHDTWWSAIRARRYGGERLGAPQASASA